MPIIDYHCHLPPDQIAQDRSFENLTQIWLNGDHYKWRAMRGNGINEKFITGNVSDYEKFEKWAETVPYTLRNLVPLDAPRAATLLRHPKSAQSANGKGDLRRRYVSAQTTGILRSRFAPPDERKSGLYH